MEQVLIWLLFAVGLVLIVKGGDYFVDAASWIAEGSGVPKFVIGATIVSIATTLPEVIVSLVAALQHETEMAVGNAVGSVTANIGLITGILFVCMPFAVERKQFFVKSLLMIASCAALLLFSFGGELGAAGTAVLFIIFAVFVTENIISARRESQKEGAKKASSKAKAGETAQNIVKFILGAAGIVIGARLLVDNGTKIAQMFGVDERVIGLTMVAVGTSLPELVTTVTAIVKKQSGLSIGNIIGANIIDISIILPLCSLVSGGALPIAQQTVRLDLPICLVIILLAMLPVMITGKAKRYQGVLMLVVYVGYILTLVLF